MLSIFQIVNFPNAECVSDTGDDGVCMTAAECLDISGQVSGACAQGFGSCCLVVSEKCGGDLPHNNTYIRNVNYPETSSESQTCEWKIIKKSADICFIRFDFDEMTIAPPDSTTATKIGQCLTDYFQGTNAQSGNNLGTLGSGRGSPKICGVNTGSHMYIDAGARSEANGLLTAVFTGTTVARKWKVKIGQIPCDGVTNPRFGCLQSHGYHWIGEIVQFPGSLRKLSPSC